MIYIVYKWFEDEAPDIEGIYDNLSDAVDHAESIKLKYYPEFVTVEGYELNKANGYHSVAYKRKKK